MGKIVFFCIPAHGHTNPTLGVVRELRMRGHQVFYYSYEQMREKIEAAGAVFIACDVYDPQLRLCEEDGERLGKDLAFSTKLLVDMTLALDDAVLKEMQKLQPDVIVADSMAYWGKLIAGKLGIPFLSSTTTFAFNRYSSKILKGSGGGLFAMLAAMPAIHRNLNRLRKKGYPVKNILSIIGNDNDTDTVVYTAPEFQPCADTFSEKYHFVGVSLRPSTEKWQRVKIPTIYVSMGTVLRREEFYRNCIEAWKELPYRVILSVGEGTKISSLGELPENIYAAERVDQIAVLKVADAFFTHAGMNSVNEALFFGVPMALFPQTPEQTGVANRTCELGAGFSPKDSQPETLRKAAKELLENLSYRTAAGRLSEAFGRLKGAGAAADAVENLIRKFQERKQ